MVVKKDVIVFHSTMTDDYHLIIGDLNDLIENKDEIVDAFFDFESDKLGRVLQKYKLNYVCEEDYDFDKYVKFEEDKDTWESICDQYRVVACFTNRF